MKNNYTNIAFWMPLCCIFILSSLFFTSCNKDEAQAQASIEGLWDVVTITSYYGDFSGNGFNPTETVTASGELGTFDFAESTVDFQFVRNDTLFSGNSTWALDMEKVNAGFVKVPEFSLNISDEFLFIVAFEDETKNAERNATEAVFAGQPTGNDNIFIEIALEKR